LNVDDETESFAHYSRWKNGRRFQSHAYIPQRIQSRGRWPVQPTIAIPPPPDPTDSTSISPQAAAASLVAMYGATRAQRIAEAQGAQHREYSDGRVFYDQVARAIERGVAEALKAGA
jgi:hypothetical protein